MVCQSQCGGRRWEQVAASSGIVDGVNEVGGKRESARAGTASVERGNDNRPSGC